MTSIRDLAIATLMASDSESNEAEMISVRPKALTRDENQYSCKVCRKSFSRKSELERHMKTHTGVKPYNCTFCKMKFSQKSNLKRHTLTHTGVKPYNCALCGKGFSQKYNLKQHSHIHKEKPYDCKDCGKFFPSRTHRTHHMLSHTGEKPYLCHLCGKQYALKTSLNLHIKKKHVSTLMAPRRTQSIHIQDDEAMSQWTKTVINVESSSCPECKNNICRCSEKMSPKGPPECSSCNNSVCVCNTLYQNEYKEFRSQGFTKVMKIDNDDEPDQKEFTYDNEDDVGYKAWCVDSEKRWALRRIGQQNTDNSECVITHDESDDKCYKKWLQKLYREDPRRTNQSVKGISEDDTDNKDISSKRVTSFISHCCGRKMLVDLDKNIPLDDMKSSCDCNVSSGLRIQTPYQINNRSRLRDYWPDLD